MFKLPPIFSRVAAGALLLLASLSVVGTANAQTQTVDERWRPWLGCWVPGDSPAVGLPGTNVAGGLVCISPAASGAGVELATVSNGVVVHREFLNPTGARTPKTVDNCPGWDSGTWSADGRRLLLLSLIHI